MVKACTPSDMKLELAAGPRRWEMSPHSTVWIALSAISIAERKSNKKIKSRNLFFL